jgi:hypothetical protein
MPERARPLKSGLTRSLLQHTLTYAEAR